MAGRHKDYNEERDGIKPSKELITVCAQYQLDLQAQRIATLEAALRQIVVNNARKVTGGYEITSDVEIALKALGYCNPKVTVK